MNDHEVSYPPSTLVSISIKCLGIKLINVYKTFISQQTLKKIIHIFIFKCLSFQFTYSYIWILRVSWAKCQSGQRFSRTFCLLSNMSLSLKPELEKLALLLWSAVVGHLLYLCALSCKLGIQNVWEFLFKPFSIDSDVTCPWKVDLPQSFKVFRL